MKQLLYLLMIFCCASHALTADGASEVSLPKVALLPFHAPSQYQEKAEIISAMLEMTLLRENTLEILDRKNVSSLLNESEIFIGSRLSESQYKDAGKLLGADYLVQAIVATYTNTSPVINITVLDCHTAAMRLKISRIIPVDGMVPVAEDLARAIVAAVTHKTTPQFAVAIGAIQNKSRVGIWSPWGEALRNSFIRNLSMSEDFLVIDQSVLARVIDENAMAAAGFTSNNKTNKSNNCRIRYIIEGSFTGQPLQERMTMTVTLKLTDTATDKVSNIIASGDSNEIHNIIDTLLSKLSPTLSSNNSQSPNIPTNIESEKKYLHAKLKDLIRHRYATGCIDEFLKRGEDPNQSITDALENLHFIDPTNCYLRCSLAHYYVVHARECAIASNPNSNRNPNSPLGKCDRSETHATMLKRAADLCEPVAANQRGNFLEKYANSLLGHIYALSLNKKNLAQKELTKENIQKRAELVLLRIIETLPPTQDEVNDSVDYIYCPAPYLSKITYIYTNDAKIDHLLATELFGKGLLAALKAATMETEVHKIKELFTKSADYLGRKDIRQTRCKYSARTLLASYALNGEISGTEVEKILKLNSKVKSYGQIVAKIYASESNWKHAARVQAQFVEIFAKDHGTGGMGYYFRVLADYQEKAGMKTKAAITRNKRTEPDAYTYYMRKAGEIESGRGNIKTLPKLWEEACSKVPDEINIDRLYLDFMEAGLVDTNFIQIASVISEHPPPSRQMKQNNPPPIPPQLEFNSHMSRRMHSHLLNCPRLWDPPYLWMAINSNGILRYNSETEETMQIDFNGKLEFDGYPAPQFVKHGQQTFFCFGGNPGGLLRIDHSGKTHIFTEPNAPVKAIRTIISKNDFLWVTEYEGALRVLDDSTGLWETVKTASKVGLLHLRRIEDRIYLIEYKIPRGARQEIILCEKEKGKPARLKVIPKTKASFLCKVAGLDWYLRDLSSTYPGNLKTDSGLYAVDPENGRKITFGLGNGIPRFIENAVYEDNSLWTQANRHSPWHTISKTELEHLAKEIKDNKHWKKIED